MSSNSTAVAATIGVSALGMLAYLGYQNIQFEEEDIDKNNSEKEETNLKMTESQIKDTDKKVLENVETETKDDLQKQAEDVVSKAIEKKATEWAKFWQEEYSDIKEENKSQIQSEPIENM